MSGADWQEHADSNHDYVIGLDTVVAPAGAGVNSLKIHGPAGTSYKRVIYTNTYLNNVSGSQQLSLAVRFAANAEDVRVGLLGMWDGVSFDDTDKAYAAYMKSVSPTELGLYLSHGPAEAGTLIAGPDSMFLFDNWYQLLFQLKFDQLGNLQLRAAISDAQVEPLDTPVYVLDFDVSVIDKVDARRYGKFAFFIDSRQENFDVYVDQISLDTTLTAI